MIRNAITGAAVWNDSRPQDDVGALCQVLALNCREIHGLAASEETGEARSAPKGYRAERQPVRFIRETGQAEAPFRNVWRVTPLRCGIPLA